MCSISFASSRLNQLLVYRWVVPSTGTIARAFTTSPISARAITPRSPTSRLFIGQWGRPTSFEDIKNSLSPYKEDIKIGRAHV